MPRYIPSWEGPTSELAQKYPLQLISPHARFSYHTHHDFSVWLGDIPACRVYKDGYYWHTTRIHPKDAEERGIKDGDIIKMHNDRGAVLGIAQVTERMRPGVVHSYRDYVLDSGWESSRRSGRIGICQYLNSFGWLFDLLANWNLRLGIGIC